MARIVTRAAFTGLAVIALLSSDPTFAQNKTSGAIELESTSVKKTPFEEVKAGAHFFIDTVVEEVHSLAKGDAGVLPAVPSDTTIRYLAASYLHCSVQRGTCPEILDAILEYDIIRSRIQKTASCPTMLRFWDYWIRDDLEKRHQYLTKTGFLSITTDFRKTIRPRYIKCGPTVAKELDGDQVQSVYFSRRYATSAAIVKSIDNAKVIMDGIREKVPNVFSAVGIKP